jgi:hypothetical protein
MDLRSALLGCSTGQLSRIAAAWMLSVEAGTLRRELVETVAARIEAELEAGGVWDALGDLERQAVAVLVRAGGRHEADLLGHRLGRRLTVVDADEATRAVDAAVGGLVERGLLFRVYDAEEQRRGVYLVMPDEVLESASLVFGASGDRDDPSASMQPDQVAVIDPAADLFALASALRREAWGNASRGLARRRALTVSQIIGRLRQQTSNGPGDPGRRWRFLLWVAQRAGWIGRDRWPMPEDELIARLLADPGNLPAQALAAGPVAEPGPTRGGSPERYSPRKRQADALQVLSELDEGAWWPARELAGWLAQELDSGDGRPVAGQRSAASDRPGAPRRPASSDRTEQQIERWLGGRWFWLGLVTWGWDGSAWGLVSPTPALRALTTGRSQPGSQLWSPCVTEDGLRLAAPIGADLATLYRAEPYLAFAGTEAGIRRYGLTPASFERGLRLGGDADDLLALLGRLIQEPPPPAWQAAIEQWASGSSRLKLEARLVLSSDRAETLAEGLSTPGVADAVTEHLSPRHALVAGERVAGLLAELARAGLPVEIAPGLRAESGDPGRAAALAGGVAETAWVALEVLRRLAPEVVAEQRDLQAARDRLEAVLAAGVLEALGRRAATISAAISEQRRGRGRRRVV